MSDYIWDKDTAHVFINFMGITFYNCQISYFNNFVTDCYKWLDAQDVTLLPVVHENQVILKNL